MSPAVLSPHFPRTVPEAVPAAWGPATFHWLTGGAAILLLAFALLLAQSLGLDGLAGQLSGSLAGAAALVALASYCRWAGLVKFQEVALLGLWAVLLSNGISLLIQAAGRSPAPLMDAQLAGIDQWFGFSTSAVVQWVALYPALRTVLDSSYKLLPVLILLSLFVPALCGHQRHARRFVASVMIAAGITAVVFAFVPAAGPWVAHGYEPSAMQSDVTAYLDMLKSGARMAIDPDASAVVSFPSFHIVLALLPVFALWPIRSMRVPMVAIALLICASTITTGWHYGVDVAGGLGTTLLARRLAGHCV